MVGLITTPDRAAAVRRAAERAGDGVGYERVGPLDSAATRAAFEEAARAPLDVLVLDLDAAPGLDLAAAVRQYRIARPATRIIALAPGREAGEHTCAALVARGVYDIIAAAPDADWTALVGEALTRPPATYREAARWDVEVVREQAATKQSAERVVIETRPGRQLILCCATGPGAGATTLALSVAGYLARRGMRVVVADAASRPVLGWVSDPDRTLAMGGGRCAYEIDARRGVIAYIRGVVEQTPQDRIALLQEAGEAAEKARADAIIVDAGGAEEDPAIQALRVHAGLVLTAIPAAAWRVYLYPSAQARPLVVTPADTSMARDVAQAFGGAVLPLPPEPVGDPAAMGAWPDAHAEAWRDTLARVLPERREVRTRRGWRLWPVRP